ncbi:uncharacterized protein LOC125876887 isoform X2 [Solanum stenotomum]|uniref:uncharacterized protein LOC125876887 isoform X2 n=1 Tax=Solanum stenotomum TaxID=172797 RepID=UPI0020D1978F|nr:uncharacterized protein LOC125876887 isoform X2 [Solanum stenotomum]
MEKSRSKSWVGNIYHKFEAVCQEVDEFVTKDTVKYVENQVQTVGANMKKFYSGVVPDFLIPVDSSVKKEAQAVNEKPKHAVGTHTSSVANTTQNPIQEKSCQNQNSLESHGASTSTELDGVVASEEAEIDVSVGNECATAICKNSCKFLKENKTREEALVVDEPSTSEDRVSSESCSDKDSNDTMCYSFPDDDKCFSDVSSSQSILQDDMVGEEQPLAKGSSSFLDILSLSQLTASMNEKMFDSSPDAINCISNVPSSQMVLQQNITREVEPVADQSNSFGEMALSKSLPFSMGESRGNSTMTKLRHPTSNYDTELRTFPEDESISNASITPTNLQDNITSEDQLASKESSSVEDKTLPQTPAFASVIPPSRNDAGFGVSTTVNKSFLGDVTFVFEESSTTLALKDAPSTFQSSELVLSRVMENKSMDVDSGISNCSLLKESSSLSTSSIGNCMQEAESDLSISTGHSSALSTSLASANNVVSVIPALSSTPLTDFSGCMNDSSIDLPGMETIDLTDKEIPKESCALVDYKLHHLVSSRPRKYKSYKELIQEAFAPRKRRIKEYEQLAVLYADVDAETSQHVELSQLPSLPSPCLHSMESSTCNICEPEWELL